jgi:hypothetical protein
MKGFGFANVLHEFCLSGQFGQFFVSGMSEKSKVFCQVLRLASGG